ncbi:Uncharacterised protein [uncultured archaeon]|nr:Uncharacterised protein [uncultured archaeon]
MCGPSGGETAAAGAQSSLATTMAANYGQRFGEQSGVLSSLRSMFMPIAQAGPDQQGFGANELAALSTGAREGVAANYSKASLALNNTLAARGGGSEMLPTGARAALTGSLASAAAAESSKQQQNITLANYAQGRQNWTQATAGLEALGRDYNPTAYGAQASSANEASFKMQSEISQEKNQMMSDIVGGAVGLGMNFLPGGQVFKAL